MSCKTISFSGQEKVDGRGLAAGTAQGREKYHKDLPKKNQQLQENPKANTNVTKKTQISTARKR